MKMQQVVSKLQIIFCFSLKVLFLASLVQGSDGPARKPYIVYMGDKPRTTTSATIQHHNMLLHAIGNEQVARKSKIHTYSKSFNGFVAQLLPQEAQRLSEEDGVVSVFANTRRKLHTTRSWDFIGMPINLQKRNPNVESNLVIGILDTGIYTQAPSFNDDGYGPVPSKWKGGCAKGANFTGCNNKVIGAKYFNLANQDPTLVQSPVDEDGHGTHTASTAAGSVVNNASFFGIGEGTARGGVPHARIAMYKVCWGIGCTDMDLLAGFDEAIADGVDIISVSIGGPSRSFFEDPIAIGSFHAMKKGILTSCSAGNDGPSAFTVQNVAPWIMTVAASTTDRQFRASVKLGNGMESSGLSINTFSPEKQMYPLISGTHAANETTISYGNASACDYGTLSQDKVKGKIVYCLGDYGQEYNLKELGAAGIITSNTETDIASVTFMPSTSVNISDGKKIDRYINKTKQPQAAISKTKAVNIVAPSVASFSSRGPQVISLNILKPDIAAPGMAILAGFSEIPAVTGSPTDKRHSSFNILSGTSMACPHAAAAAAYVKSFHPDWSPAAIRSAIMTTATPMRIKDELKELSSGSGQINPSSALHPGLVYDIPMKSYIRFMCKEGYNDTAIAQLIGSKRFRCSNLKPALGSDGLNYPSMHIQLSNATSGISAVFHRTVTHVGRGNSIYKANVTSPDGLSIYVVPSTLNFTSSHQKQSFKVVVKGDPVKISRLQILSGSLEWSDSRHMVKSPIVIYIGRYDDFMM